MAQLVKQDTRVLNVGLCNFDTQRMNEVVESGVQIVSNQVQVSEKAAWILRDAAKRDM
jgi:diketogulonate reductase-like aldo/keto reductase